MLCFPKHRLSFFSIMTCIVSSLCMSVMINADSNNNKVKLRFIGTWFCKAGMAIGWKSCFCSVSVVGGMLT